MISPMFLRLGSRQWQMDSQIKAAPILGGAIGRVGLWIYFSPYQSRVRAGAQPIECAVAHRRRVATTRISLRSIPANCYHCGEKPVPTRQALLHQFDEQADD
jgi:hypothetical protein